MEDLKLSPIDLIKIETDELWVQLGIARMNSKVVGEQLLLETAMREGARAWASNNYPRLVNARKFMLEALTGKECLE